MLDRWGPRRGRHDNLQCVRGQARPAREQRRRRGGRKEGERGKRKGKKGNEKGGGGRKEKGGKREREKERKNYGGDCGSATNYGGDCGSATSTAAVGHAARDVMAVRGEWSAVGFDGMAGKMRIKPG
jgi:hypothetical protein